MMRASYWFFSQADGTGDLDCGGRRGLGGCDHRHRAQGTTDSLVYILAELRKELALAATRARGEGVTWAQRPSWGCIVGHLQLSWRLLEVGGTQGARNEYLLGNLVATHRFNPTPQSHHRNTTNLSITTVFFTLQFAHALGGVSQLGQVPYGSHPSLFRLGTWLSNAEHIPVFPTFARWRYLRILPFS